MDFKDVFPVIALFLAVLSLIIVLSRFSSQQVSKYAAEQAASSSSSYGCHCEAEHAQTAKKYSNHY